MTKLFSNKSRPVHMGPYPVELLGRTRSIDLASVPAFQALKFERPDAPHSIINAMRDHQAMLDAIRSGLVNKSVADAPTDPQERADHLKSFGYFSDAAHVGCCLLPPQAILSTSISNPDISRLSQDLMTKQTKTLAAGIDQTMSDLRESIDADLPSIETHTHALVFLYENPRKIMSDEPGTDWIQGAYDHRAGLLASETAVVLAN